MIYNKFLILLFYYERPKTFTNALHSILNINYSNFKVHVIDDGSINKAEPIIRNYCSSIIDKFIFTYITDTVEDKIQRGGSIFGNYANLAIENSEADHIIPLCDDDAIYPNFLEKLNDLLNQNPYEKQYYHHLALYDPLKEFYLDKINNTWTSRNYHTGEILLPYNVDSCQVTFSRKAFIEDNIKYPFPQTANLDAKIFEQMGNKWGPCKFSGLFSQVKGDNIDSLGIRQHLENIYKPADMDMNL